jgi:uncharacterized protein YacL
MGLWLIRALFAAVLAGATYYLRPFESGPLWSSLIGLCAAAAIIVFEIIVRRSSLKTLIGAALGSTLGIIGAVLVSMIVRNMNFATPKMGTFVQVLILAVMGYVGLAIGVSKGELLNLGFGGLLAERPSKKSAKLLDTSAIIDGRIADIVETGFVEGQLIVPAFVLSELQMVADSADSIKRNRGRRGLDILQRLQKDPNLKVQIIDEDYPEIKGVDMKLIELGKDSGAKIVTNDFNLNKVAQLHGIAVLNINELANCLKPVVLPGEAMRVFVLKEGKEYNQGVAYLDDGTMVVVDNARRMIGKTIDIQVTSVLQTTAGKMIFGRMAANGEGPSRPDSERDRAART